MDDFVDVDKQERIKAPLPEVIQVNPRQILMSDKDELIEHEREKQRNLKIFRDFDSKLNDLTSQTKVIEDKQNKFNDDFNTNVKDYVPQDQQPLQSEFYDSDRAVRNRNDELRSQQRIERFRNAAIPHFGGQFRAFGEARE